MTKPIRLEMESGGHVVVLGRFDAADDEQSSLVLDAAEDLILTLHNSENPKGCPTLRVSTEEPMPCLLMRWSMQRGWHDAATGEPC